MSVNILDTAQYDSYLYDTMFDDFTSCLDGNGGNSKWFTQSNEWQLVLSSLIYYFSTNASKSRSGTNPSGITTFGSSITGISFDNTSKWKLYLVDILIAKYLVKLVQHRIPKRLLILHKILDISNYIKLLMSSIIYKGQKHTRKMYLNVLHRLSNIGVSYNGNDKIYRLWNYYEIDDISTYLKINYFLKDIFNTDNLSWFYVRSIRKLQDKTKEKKKKPPIDHQNEKEQPNIKCPECNLIPFNVQYVGNKDGNSPIGLCYYCKCKRDEYLL